MAVCEICWNNAYLKSRMTGRSQTELYQIELALNEGLHSVNVDDDV